MNHRLLLVVTCVALGAAVLILGALWVHPGLALMAAGALLLGFGLLGVNLAPRRVVRDGRTLQRSDR